MNRLVSITALTLLSSLASAKTPTPAESKEEVELQLKRIYQGAMASYAGHEVADAKGNVTDGFFPKSIALTPAKSCCTQPNQECTEPKWSAAPWSEVTSAPPLSSHFRYEIKSSGKGKTATFTARAVGDPTCTGKEEVWEVTSTRLKDGSIDDVAKPHRVK